MLKYGFIFRLWMAISIAKTATDIFEIWNGIHMSVKSIGNEWEIQSPWFYLHLSFDIIFYGKDKFFM